jgi:hypothetical protein
MAATKGKGNMATTEGVKHDEDKPKFSLMKPDALMEMVAVLTYGAKKYSPDNWKLLENARQRYFDAANRHLWQWYGGEEEDPESGLHHLAHAMSSLMFLIQMDIDAKESLPYVPTVNQRDWVEELNKTTKVSVSKGSHEDWVLAAEPHGY